jgi:hypothetical protein
MSIFDKRAGFDPGPWLREKTASCLREVAQLVDLANEPDTTRWYARRLRRTASGLISRLAPLTLFVHRADQRSLEDSEWNAIAEHGTLALAAWCERWGIAGARFLGQSSLLDDDDADGDDKGAVPEDNPVVDDDLTRTLDRRLELLGLMARRMLNEELPDGARRLLLLLLGHLRYSPHMDVVLVSKRVLPGDIGVSPAEAADAYRALYEHEFVERVETLSEAGGDALALRLLVEGFNDRKHATAYREETFGFPGARVGGKRTMGNVLILPLSTFVQQALRGWPALAEDDLQSLRQWLQETVGAERAFIESALLRTDDAHGVLEVKVRIPLDESDQDMKALLLPAAEAWLRKHVAGLHGPDPGAS